MSHELIIIAILFAYLVFREILNFLERKTLTDKLLSRDIHDYYGAITDQKVKVLNAKQPRDTEIAV